MLNTEKSKLAISYSGLSDKGYIREENQDSYGKFPEGRIDVYQPKGILFVIADGMGGHENGKVASSTAVDVIGEKYFSCPKTNILECLHEAFNAANDKVYSLTSNEILSQKMGTTASALVIKEDSAYVGHIGDSKIFKVSGDNIEQITTDHTAAGEMYRKGILTKEEARSYPNKSLLARAIGIEDKIKIELKENIKLSDGDCFVLCTDGMQEVKKNEIKEIVNNNTAVISCKQLVKLAKDRDGNDNITVQVIKISAFGNFTPKKKRSEKILSKLKWLGLGIVVIFLTAVIIYQLIGLKVFLQTNDNKDFIIAENQNEMLTTKNRPIINEYYKKADMYYNSNNLDTALIYYRKILEENPTSLNASSKMINIFREYIDLAEQNMMIDNYEKAYSFYTKALDIKPNDENLNALLSYCEQQLGVEENKEPLQQVSEDKTYIKDNYDNTPSESEFEMASLSPNKTEWLANDLTSEDIEFSPASLLFKATPRAKQIIYNKDYSDIDINAVITCADERFLGENGIIFGYNKFRSGGENYFSLSIDKMTAVKLNEIVNSKTILRFEVPITEEFVDNKIELRIRSLGPWIMVYIQENLIKAWIDDNIISGKIGFFADVNSEVNFKNIHIEDIIKKN